MYTTTSSIQWLRWSFHLLVRCIRHSRNDLGRWRVIRIIGPADFRQIERSCVWPESPRVGVIRLSIIYLSGTDLLLMYSRRTGHRSFSQLVKVEPKHCVVKMGITCQNLTSHRISQNRDTGFWLDEWNNWMPRGTRGPVFSFSRDLRNPG